jgi:hypothetical protein
MRPGPSNWRDEGSDELERTYWEAWQLSLHRDGNPAYLEGVFRCIDRRCKLLGLDAPNRHEIFGSGGSPVVTTVVGEVPAVTEDDEPAPAQ